MLNNDMLKSPSEMYNVFGDPVDKVVKFYSFSSTLGGSSNTNRFFVFYECFHENIKALDNSASSY